MVPVPSCTLLFKQSVMLMANKINEWRSEGTMIAGVP